jgi:catechol 2,3-dioxygenase-like lactoylglutathione lyase family enzyme
MSLTVRDPEKTAEFYATALGFVPVLELPDVEGRGFKKVLAHPESRTILGLTVHEANDGTPFTEFRTGLDHVAFGVPTRADLDEWTKRLDDLGIEHSDIRETPIGALLTLRDPDNVQVELWADVS